MVCVLEIFLHLIPFFSPLESKLGHIWLRGDVRHHLAVILHSLIPIFIPDNSARYNPNTSANPHHLDLLPVLPGTLVLHFRRPRPDFDARSLLGIFPDTGAVPICCCLGGMVKKYDVSLPWRFFFWTEMALCRIQPSNELRQRRKAASVQNEIFMCSWQEVVCGARGNRK